MALIAVAGVVIYGFATGQFSLDLPDAEKPSAHVAAAVKPAKTKTGIPADYLDLYKANAGKCAGLDWAVLAAQGFVESDHGRSPLPGVKSGANKAGAMGPMQFKAGTWGEVRGDRPDIGANVYDPANAIPAAAHYVCKYAAKRGGINGGLNQYGGDGKYVTKVLNKAKEYRAAA